MAEGLTFERRDAASIVRFARPEKKNALKSFMYTAIAETMAEAECDPAVTAHVFIGSEGVFTAGNDITEFADRANGDTALSGHVQNFIRSLPNIKKPMIAAVDGLAVGIGTTLLMHCDLVYATPTASLRTPFANLGLVPEAGSSLIAPRLMGHARAFELLVLGQPFDAETAQAAGLINRIVPAEELEQTALAAVAQLAAKPPEALAKSRALLRGSADEIAARIDHEIGIFTERLASPEAREAFAAFFEKRAPDFSKTRSTG
ncbi:MAG: crotonase/enoyl-CoA hydratase family protein [Pseudomonadota bacterium]